MGRHFVAAALVHLSAAACSIGPSELLLAGANDSGTTANTTEPDAGELPPPDAGRPPSPTDAGEPPPPPDAGEPPPCSELDQEACEARSDCRGSYCPYCGLPSFIGCFDPRTPGPHCPFIPCVCSRLDADNCLASDQCHAIFAESTEVEFSRCADGPTAYCPAQVLCERTKPTCPEGYFPAAFGPCWEGCALGEECVGPEW